MRRHASNKKAQDLKNRCCTDQREDRRTVPMSIHQNSYHEEYP